jgi:ferredoxin-thioredoxin reductase catalytic subunit
MTLEQVRRRAEDDAKSSGYSLNYDRPFLTDLLEGLRKNEERFGYPSCPCRIAAGKFELDRDIICPCDYRDPDVLEFGACYCALFIRNEIAKDRLPLSPVPERRPEEKQARVMDYKMGRGKQVKPAPASIEGGLAIDKEATVVPRDAREEGVENKSKMWYCRQCGYVVFRDDPPYICPICKARRELFSEIRFDIKDTG